MSPKILWKSLLVTPAILGTAIFASSSAIASEEINTDVTSVSSLEQIADYANEGSVDSMGQVTSITQLSDVQPTDWAYQALSSLIDRYGCIAGYPDGTFRGNQAMTRYEFAAGLNACLEGFARTVTGGDLTTLEQLLQQFEAELATLRGRVDALEARTAQLEANQFSTTTKLNGNAIFSTAAVLDSDEVFDDQVTFGYRTEMNFDSSFTGDDRLRIRLRARDVQDFAADPIGFSYGGSNGGDVVLDNLFYDFPLTNSIDVRIGANSLAVDDFVASTISPLDSSTSGSLSNFGFPQQYNIAAVGDAGAGVIVQLTDNLSLDLGYTAGEAASPLEGSGLFNGPYSAIGQLTFLSGSFDAALTYIRTYNTAGLGVPDYNANNFGFQGNFRLNDTIEIGGGVAYSDVDAIGSDDDAEVWSYQGTLAFNDLGGSGNMLGVLAGIVPYSRDNFGLVGGAPARSVNTSFLAEVFYRLQVNDRISVTPSVIYLDDPGNNDALDSSLIGAIRTTFSF
ncbi:MAG TPA: iron uptake porin [Candidatus Obscuribacterales bacterium]